MTISTKTKRPRRQYPWKDWLKGTPSKPLTLTFGKEVPADKKPSVLVAQLHEWGKALKIWVYTSVDHDKKFLRVYGVPEREGQERPQSIFPSPKIGTQHMAKKKAAKKADTKSAKKAPKKGKAKKGEAA